jgi:hypothetical protein
MADLKIYFGARPMLGFSLGQDEAPMDLVLCSDGTAHHAGQCPMSVGAKVAIGGVVVTATGLVLWLAFRRG